MNLKFLENLLKNRWYVMPGYYIKMVNGTRYIYDVETRTFSYLDNFGIEHYLCKATLENLEKIEKGGY